MYVLRTMYVKSLQGSLGTVAHLVPPGSKGAGLD